MGRPKRSRGLQGFTPVDRLRADSLTERFILGGAAVLQDVFATSLFSPTSQFQK